MESGPKGRRFSYRESACANNGKLRPDFSTDSTHPYFYEYSTTANCVSVSRGATEAPKKDATCAARPNLSPPPSPRTS
jgi:hypothetical protein